MLSYVGADSISAQKITGDCVPPYNLAELILALKLLNTSSSINYLLRTCEEWVTLIADVDRELRLV
jgi:hypothetical protein